MSITREDVEVLNRKFIEAWNAGDLKTACCLYATNAVYITASGITIGREAIYEKYKKSYTSNLYMGKLFLDISFFEVSEDGKTAYVVSAWKLEEKSHNSEGTVTEIFQLIDGKLFIVHDVTW
jgi:ketosteroid isomerase-like protein